MPILFVIVLIVAAALVRVGQGRRPLPAGHHLLIKMFAVLLLFGVYTTAMWSSRRNFCAQMSGLVQELTVKATAQQSERFQALRKKQAELERKLAPESRPVGLDKQPAGPSDKPVPDAEQAKITGKLRQELADLQREIARAGQPHSADAISADDLSKRIGEMKVSPAPAVGEVSHSAKVSALLAVMQESWHVKPREYVLSAIEFGYLSPSTAANGLSTYFYLTHGVRVLDVTWHARAQFSPHWASTRSEFSILRVFFPQNSQLASMGEELKSTDVLGFFPTAWGAAYIDFGAAGAIIYVLIWGFAAGSSASGARRSTLVTPSLLLSFMLASILLSSVQGPLGIANSAMVLASMAVLGLAIDRRSLSEARQRGGLKPETTGPKQVSAP